MALVSTFMLTPDPRQAVRVWFRHALAWTRFYKTSILLNFGEPVSGLLGLGLGLGSYVHLINGMTFLQFIGPGLVAVTAMNATTFDSLFTTYGFLNNTKVYPAMITAPLSVDDIVAGALLWQATRAVLYGSIFLAIIAIFHLVHSWTVILALPVLFLSGILFAAPAMCVGALAKVEEQTFYYLTLVVTPMYMFSGIFFPVTRLPAGIRGAIWFSPLYHAANLTRSLVLGRLSSALWGDLLWLIVVTAALVLIPSRLIARKLLV